MPSNYDPAVWQSPGCTRNDAAQALPSILLRRAGYVVNQPHPLTDELAERCNLGSMAAWLNGDGFNPSDRAGILSAVRSGIGSIQFASALEQTGREIIRQSFGRRANINLVARSLPQRDYKDFERTIIGVHGMGDDGQPENAESPLIYGTGHTVKTGKLVKYLDSILVREMDIINDDAELVAQLFEAAAQMAHAREWRALIQTFDTNPQAPELDAPTGTARAYFTTADGNLVGTAGAPSTTSIEAALSLLRRQPGADGKPMGLAPARLLVPAEYEMTIRRILKEHEMPDVTVIVSTDIDDAFYVLADPKVYAPLGVSFVGPAGSPIRTTQVEQVPKLSSEYGGKSAAGFKVRQAFRPQLLSRRGIVRVPIS